MKTWKYNYKVLLLHLVAFVSAATSCGLGEFKCTASKKCISRELQCDGYKDCDDGTDEFDCEFCSVDSRCNKRTIFERTIFSLNLPNLISK